MPISEKKREQLANARARMKELGIVPGRKPGQKTKAVLEREKVKTYVEQRYMAVADRLANAQISIAVGQQFLFKIEKKKIVGPKGGISYENQKPVLVTNQFEIENYLAELAENNGDISDDKDPGDTYYFITTKEPNNEALKDIQNRVLGKPKETVEVVAHLSLLELARIRDQGTLGPVTEHVEALPAPQERANNEEEQV